MNKTVECGLLASVAAISAYAADITVDVAKEIGPIRRQNAVNGAPWEPNTENFAFWKDANIPYARTHDLDLVPRFGNPHSFNVEWIFKNFDADENDPKNYDFAITDAVVDRIFQAGSKPFFRLGGMFEGWFNQRYTTLPPKDYAKWARIAEHIVAHYTEGWGGGRKHDIEYWEIWNEPDHRMFWAGTQDQFIEFFTVVQSHLKKRFPNLKIGGAAFTGGNMAYVEAAVKALRDKSIPLDFLSWHGYGKTPGTSTAQIRGILTKYGYGKAELILDEWNYIKDFWGDAYTYSLEVERGRFTEKAAAFNAAQMCQMQRDGVDMAMYYCAIWSTPMDGLFDTQTGRPLKGYYPFVAWSRLLKLGTEVSTSVNGAHDIWTTAAKGKDGRCAMIVSRYNDDNNVVDSQNVVVRLAGGAFGERTRVLVTDDFRLFTDSGFVRNADGSFVLRLRPNAFALIEWE